MFKPDTFRLRTTIGERLASIDPGLIRLRFALAGALSFGLTIGAEYVFVHWTGALHIPVPDGAAAAVVAHIDHANHVLLATADLLGVLAALTVTLSAVDARPRQQMMSAAWIPVPMIGSMAAATALSSQRVLSLVGMVAVIGLAGYIRSRGAPGQIVGMSMFLGYFVGYTLDGKIPLAEIGWPAAEIGVGIVVALVVKMTLFRPNPSSSVRRMDRSFQARAKDILLLAEATLAAREPAAARRLRRHLKRHNESGLMLDAALASAGPDAVSLRVAHEEIFDLEENIGELGRAAHLVAGQRLPVEVRGIMKLALVAIRQGDLVGARVLARELQSEFDDHSGRHLAPSTAPDGDQKANLVSRFARAVLYSADSLDAWADRDRAVDLGLLHVDPLVLPPPPLIIGWLPGTVISSARASAAPPVRSGYSQLRMPAHIRSTVQMTVAATLAAIVGNAISGRHVIWAVMPAFLLFFGPLNAGEQVSRSVTRMIGTVVGIVAVVGLAHVFGDNIAAAVAITVVGGFLALYMMRINPGYMVFGLTVVISEFYIQVDQYSDALLRLRIEEIAAASACVVFTVLFVVPLHPSRVLRAALQAYLTAAAELLSAVGAQFSAETPAAAAAGGRRNRRPAEKVKPLIRRLDLAYQSLDASLTPWSRLPLVRGAARAKAVAVAVDRSHRDVRYLASGLRSLDHLDHGSRVTLATASRALASSTRETLAFIGDNRVRTYARLALPVTAGGPRRSGLRAQPGSLAPNDRDQLLAVDDSFAGLATALGMQVRNAEFSTERSAAGGQLVDTIA